MILYDPRQAHSLEEFGILIPVRESRAQKTFARLSAHPVLGPQRAAWHVARWSETLAAEDLLRAHSPEYVARLTSEGLEEEILRAFELLLPDGTYHRYDPTRARLPLRDLWGRILERAAGTLAGARIAQQTGFCFYFGGGMHHAHRDFGAGFCLVNDLVISLRRLQAEGRVRRAWVIDVDAHKGDGTAALTAGDPTIATLSIHMAAGWPLDQPPVDAAGVPNPSFIPSTVDIPVAEGEEADYNPRLREGLERLAAGHPGADLALVVCGADPYEEDELPSAAGLRLTLGQLFERDRMVWEFLRARRVPGAWVMAGGYGRESWRVYTQFLEWALAQQLSTH